MRGRARSATQDFRARKNLTKTSCAWAVGGALATIISANGV